MKWRNKIINKIPLFLSNSKIKYQNTSSRKRPNRYLLTHYMTVLFHGLIQVNYISIWRLASFTFTNVRSGQSTQRWTLSFSKKFYHTEEKLDPIYIIRCFSRDGFRIVYTDLVIKCYC
jgi:hypothetical protein